MHECIPGICICESPSLCVCVSSWDVSELFHHRIAQNSVWKVWWKTLIDEFTNSYSSISPCDADMIEWGSRSPTYTKSLPDNANWGHVAQTYNQREPGEGSWPAHGDCTDCWCTNNEWGRRGGGHTKAGYKTIKHAYKSECNSSVYLVLRVDLCSTVWFIWRTISHIMINTLF